MFGRFVRKDGLKSQRFYLDKDTGKVLYPVSRIAWNGSPYFDTDEVVKNGGVTLSFMEAGNWKFQRDSEMRLKTHVTKGGLQYSRLAYIDQVTGYVYTDATNEELWGGKRLPRQVDLENDGYRLLAVNPPSGTIPLPATKTTLSDNPYDRQHGGDHYKGRGLEPMVYILANKLGFCEGNIVKYITRYKDKGGKEDLEKIKHYVDFLIEHHYGT